MNWQAISFDWNQVRAFYAAVEEGSFSGAARALNTTQPTIGRQIAALEERLGITLVERTVKGLQLTTTGEALLDYVRSMSEAATMISAVSDSKSQDISGEVSIAASDLMSSAILPEITYELRATAPRIHLNIIASNDIQNLITREADIAVRHIRPEQPELFARHIGDFEANLYASSAYLDSAGRPNSLQDISGHDFIANAPVDHLAFQLRDQGIPVQESQFVVSARNGTVAWALMKTGYGMAMQPDGIAKNEPGIEQVFPMLPSQRFPVWLVTHRELKTSPKIRIVFDTLASGLKKLGRST